MKILIDVETDYYEMIKYNVEHGQEYKPFEIIANGIPYEERPHGDWISTTFMGQTCLKCNQCRRVDFGIKYYNFCPNCGASMMKGGTE